jgi:hypothetical protein
MFGLGCSHEDTHEEASSGGNSFGSTSTTTKEVCDDCGKVVSSSTEADDVDCHPSSNVF